MMRKTGVLALCVLLLGGCARRVENPGPPQITILEDAVIEVNQPDFSEDYFKAVDSQGNELPAENVVFLNNANNSLLGTSYIKIKAVDKNGYYDVKTLKVTTGVHTAPTYVLPVQPPVGACTVMGSPPFIAVLMMASMWLTIASHSALAAL